MTALIADATAAQTLSATAEAMVAEGRSTWGQEPPPLQARKAGQVTFARGAPLPAPAQQPPVLQSPDALTAVDWQPVASLPSGPRSRPDAQDAVAIQRSPEPLATARPLPQVAPQASPQIVPRVAPPQTQASVRDRALRRQAEMRSLEFRRRWLIGNFY